MDNKKKKARGNELSHQLKNTSKDLCKTLQKTLAPVKRKSAVCTISGGLDSAVAAAIIAKANFKLHFIFFNWGQKTRKKELLCAQNLAKYYHTSLKIVNIPLLKNLPGISLTKKETLTTAINEYVPNRNAIFESQAVTYAEFLKSGIVCIGSTGGDHVCPDNSPQFINAMQNLIKKELSLNQPYN